MTTPRPLAMTAERVREARAALGLVQEEMAPKLLVSLRQYKRYEKHGIPRKARLRAQLLEQLATAKRARRG